jgi:hypothetical protein
VVVVGVVGVVVVVVVVNFGNTWIYSSAWIENIYVVVNHRVVDIFVLVSHRVVGFLQVLGTSPCRGGAVKIFN